MATRPTRYTRPLAEREHRSGLGGPAPGRARQVQGRERGTPTAPLNPRDVRRPQRASTYHRRCQYYWIWHNDDDYGARAARELGGCVRGKSAARRGATTQEKAAAAPATSLRRENGRVSRGALGDTRRQSRLPR